MTGPTEPLMHRPDGSLDCAAYMARGRNARAEQARHLTSAAVCSLPRIATLLVWACVATGGLWSAAHLL